MRLVHKNRTGQPWVKPGHDEEWVTASPNPPYELAIKSLFRCDLPRYRRRRIGEVLRQLRVTRLGVLHRFLLHRPETADAIRQRKNLDRSVERERREHR